MPDAKSNMYANTMTWNPFKGCKFDCTYCEPSFKRQAKRQKGNCPLCYKYVPHYHEERLSHIPSTPIVFVCGNADLAFCKPAFMRRIIEAIRRHRPRNTEKTFYFQSKKPAYFQPFLPLFPENVILLTTLETNRDEGYKTISNAPLPTERYRQFKDLDYPRKAVTVEPIMDFDEEVFPGWIVDLRPEHVWLGLNSKPHPVLPEPPIEKVRKLVRKLKAARIDVRGKELRGHDLGIKK